MIRGNGPLAFEGKTNSAEMIAGFPLFMTFSVIYSYVTSDLFEVLGDVSERVQPISSRKPSVIVIGMDRILLVLLQSISEPLSTKDLLRGQYYKR